MKKSELPPASVPRLNSLLHRLQQKPGPEDQPYLDQLMLFLDDPPDGVKDRFKEGAALCAEWGVATTRTSVWRLHQSYAVEWRVRLSLAAETASAEKPEHLRAKAAQLTGLRICELLANPNTDAATLVSLARLGLRQEMLDLARQKTRAVLRDDSERALAVLDQCARGNFDAQFALTQLKKALQLESRNSGKFTFPPALLEYLINQEKSKP